jgi:hypothetical protein
MAWSNSADPDHLAQQCHLIRIYTVCFEIYEVFSDQDVTSADPDQTTQMCWLIWIYAGHMRKNVYIWRKGLLDLWQAIRVKKWLLQDKVSGHGLPAMHLCCFLIPHVVHVFFQIWCIFQVQTSCRTNTCSLQSSELTSQISASSSNEHLLKHF